MGERELTVEINGVSRVHRGYTHLFPSFFKRWLHLSGAIGRNCERIHPAIGRCIPADLSAALSPPATGLRYRWSFPIFYTGAGDLSARSATLAHHHRLQLSATGPLPVGQRLETDSALPRFIALRRRFTPRFVYCPSRRRTRLRTRSAAILLVPNTALSRCFVWKEEDSKVTDVKFRREIRIKGDFSNLGGRKGGWELYNLIEWTVTMFLRSRGCLSGVWPVKNEGVNEGWISDWISLPRSNNFGIIFEGRIMAIYRSLGKLGNNAAQSMMISMITTVPGCTFRTDPEFRITA